jgi:hypothetical protein
MTTANEKRLRKVLERIWEIGNGSDYDFKTMKKIMKIIGYEIRRQYVRDAKEVQNQAKQRSAKSYA